MEESRENGDSVVKTAAPKKKSNNKPGIVDSIKEFAHGVKTEFRKIIWPDCNALVKQTTAVVVVAFITGALIAGLDYVFEYGINFLTGLNL